MLILVSSIMDGGVLGQDGDAAFAFQVVGIHDALGNGFVGAEGAGLAQHGVHQRGLAVVDVGDDGDISDGRAHGREFLFFRVAERHCVEMDSLALTCWLE